MSVKKNIRQLREKMNMSQELLAEKMNLTRQAVSKWESGESNPSTRNLLQLAKIFNVTVDTLIANTEDILIGEAVKTERDTLKCENKKIRTVDWVKILSVLSLMLAFGPFSVAVMFHRFLPNTIPMHYNSMGEIDRYGSRNELLILGSCLSLFVIVATILLIVIKYNKKEKIMLLMSSLVVPIVFIVMQSVFSVKAMNEAGIEAVKGIEIMGVMSIAINVLMVFFGIALPFTKQNPILGIRISSTMNSSENWIKTHRIAAITIVLGGVVGALFAAFLNGYLVLLSNIFLAIALIIPVIYSVKIAKGRDLHHT